MLSISDTYIMALMIKSIIKLQKLQYIHAGNKSEVVAEETSLMWRHLDILLVGTKLCALCLCTKSSGH
jgi:hypothetical protein